ncbi:hypothetical protein, variant 1 [Aphanomyces invadans]|nr:hypothetical protein, variant 1 [Aphanomyces invadans]ETW08266.1 hypothetical protein, variant 1 [Aphanomyces invadans]|eukprot:XP_008862071.1 hypothetical protein, variant 1 [Aphanomyces invadans]
MLQEWERAVHRKLSENWKREFHANPMPGSFEDVSVRDRARILHALCEWRVHASDIGKFISGIPVTVPNPKDDKATTSTTAITFDSLRPEPLGEDDDGAIYWYFHDGCWVYAEDSPASSQRRSDRPVYHVRYSTPSKIRLSTHFELENNTGLDTLVETVLPSSSLKRKRSSSSKKESKKSKRSSHHRSHRSSENRREDDEGDEERYVKPPRDEKTQKVEKKLDPPIPSSPGPKPVPKVAEEMPPLHDKTSVKSEESPIPDEQDTHVLCSMCKKSYDMSLLDPPLLKKPQGEWKCFECLVNDCRGWPRRRPSRQVAPPPPPPRPPAADKKSSKKKSSSSSSSKKKSSSKSSSKSSKSHHSSSSKKKSSRKHRSSSSHSYPDEYKHLLNLYHTRKRQRDVALADSLAAGMPPPPWHDQHLAESHGSLQGLSNGSGWRVVSASVADLRDLLATKFSGVGSMAAQRLKGRLIQILKAGEAMEEEVRRLRLQQEQQLMWQMQALPRRASSRVALERLKSQSDPHYVKSDDENSWEEKLNPSTANDRALRLSRRTSASDLTPEGENQHKRRLAMERAHRASRRQREWDGPSSDEDEVVTPRQTRQSSSNHTPLKGGDLVNWKTIHDHEHPLRSVCAALVTRMIQEEKAPPFSRPVDPVADGCPDYFAVVKHPMDLATVKLRCLNGHYKTWAMFKGDMARIWANCKLYNSEGAVIVEYANELEKTYLGLVRQAEGHGATSMHERGVMKSASDDDDEEFQKSSDSSHDGSSSSSDQSSADDDSSSNSSHSSSSDEGKRQSKLRSRPSRSTLVKPIASQQLPPLRPAPKPTRWKKPQRKQRISSSSSSESDVATATTRKTALTTTTINTTPKQNNPPRNPLTRHPKTIVESSSSSSGSSSSSSEDESPTNPPPPPPSAKKKPQTPPPPPCTPPPPAPSSGSMDGNESSSSSSSYFSSSDDSD